MGRITPAERPLPRFARLVELLDAGCSTAEAVDYAATAEGPWTQTAWAEVRGISQNAVSKNVAGAREELGDRLGEARRKVDAARETAAAVDALREQLPDDA